MYVCMFFLFVFFLFGRSDVTGSILVSFQLSAGIIFDTVANSTRLIVIFTQF